MGLTTGGFARTDDTTVWRMMRMVAMMAMVITVNTCIIEFPNKEGFDLANVGHLHTFGYIHVIRRYRRFSCYIFGKSPRSNL